MEGVWHMQSATSARTMTKQELKREKSTVFRKRLKNSGVSYLMMFPFALFFLIVTVIPVLSAIVLSFTYFNMLQPPTFVGFDNYRRMLIGDPNFITVLKNTILFALVTGPIGYFMSFFFAWLINELSPRVRAVMTMIFYMPTLVGNIFFVWTYLFSGDAYGIINSVLLELGVVLEPIQWLSNASTVPIVVIVIQLWLSLGNGFLAFIAGFQGLDRSLYEAGAIDGMHNRCQELWYITLPQLAPQLMFSAVMTIGAPLASAGLSPSWSAPRPPNMRRIRWSPICRTWATSGMKWLRLSDRGISVRPHDDLQFCYQERTAPVSDR